MMELCRFDSSGSVTLWRRCVVLWTPQWICGVQNMQGNSLLPEGLLSSSRDRRCVKLVMKQKCNVEMAVQLRHIYISSNMRYWHLCHRQTNWSRLMLDWMCFIRHTVLPTDRVLIVTWEWKNSLLNFCENLLF
jgi:hypothetical protein